MPNYRRAYVPGGSFFFTLVTNQRKPLFANPQARRLLGNVIRQCQDNWPFTINAMVLLSEHLHTIWTLPKGDGDYAKRLGWLKKEFTKGWMCLGITEAMVNEACQRERRRGVWQPRYWEHTLVDEDDFEHHFDYVHYNPVKHGHVKCTRDWPWSSFHRWVKHGVYPENWACGDHYLEIAFNDIEDQFGEPHDL